MPDTNKPLSPASLAVLKAIADGSGHGFDIMDATGLPSGTVYPALARLEKAGLVRSRWEAARLAHLEKRPPRRYYEVTAQGSRALAFSMEHYRNLGSSRGARTAPNPAPKKA